MSSVNSTGLSTNGLSFSGLATGIDTQAIITGLTKLNQQSISKLQADQATITTDQAAFATLKTQLADLQTKSSSLASSISGAFDGRTATISDTTALNATATSSASAGNYTVTVGTLAQAQQLASNGFNDPNAQIQQGTFTFQVGSGTAKTVTIDGRNNTLQGLANGINNAGGDVNATVVNDGTAYHLLLTSNKTGAANTINITNNLNIGGGTALNASNTVVQAAQDASVTLGSGGGALTVTNSTNQISSLISGVTLNLLSADPTKHLSLQVANDTTSAVKSVQSFVDSFNAAIDYINTQSAYDPKTHQAGLLLGNIDAQNLKDSLTAAVNTSVPGLSSSANRLSQVGLSFDSNGKLVFDSSQLTNTLNGVGGATASDVKRLFGLTGSSNNPGVSFVLGTNATKASGSTPYQVNITNPATQGTVTAGTALAASTVLTGANNSFTLNVNGLTSSSITLTPGTYAPNALASLIQQQINSNAALNGALVSVGLNGGKLQISNQGFGSSTNVTIDSGSAIGVGGPLGFVGGESGTGTDVAGNFTVNGQVESATGSGQLLTGGSVNKNTAGLEVKATSSTPGSANVTVTQGIAAQLNNVINQYIDPTNGRLKAINDTYQSRIDDIQKTITNQNTILSQKTAELQTQFAAMETAVNNLKGVQNSLSSFVTIPFFGSTTKSG